MNARLQAFSMISSESRIVSGLRRISTPKAPVAKRNAATPRYQLTSGPSIALRTARMAAEDDAADGGEQQHDRRDLEGDQMVGEEDAADVGGAAERAGELCLVGEPPAGLEADHDDDLEQDRPGGEHRADRLPARAAGPRRLGVASDV